MSAQQEIEIKQLKNDCSNALTFTQKSVFEETYALNSEDVEILQNEIIIENNVPGCLITCSIAD